MGITLVVLAAGMGSRYGGLKQIEPVGSNGEVIADYSAYDAMRAGFDKVVFVIKREMKESFEQRISDRISKHIKTELAYQGLLDLPHGFTLPEGRVKPWGTGHAAMCAKNAVEGSCAVINADDFYGESAFKQLYSYLKEPKNNNLYNYCMVGYELKNTLSESGSVSRGECTIDENGYLLDINEITKITKTADGISYTDNDGSVKPISGATTVSMNCWGFDESFFFESEKYFANFLSTLKTDNALTSELYLPNIVKGLLFEKKAAVKVLQGKDKWLGFTYKQDRVHVVNEISKMTELKKYPANLWG